MAYELVDLEPGDTRLVTDMLPVLGSCDRTWTKPA